VLALIAASFIRPHLALLVVFAFVTALLIGRRTAVRTTVTPAFLAKLAAVAVCLVVASLLITRTQRLLGINDFSSASLESVATRQSELTNEGNSKFSAPNPRTPLGFPEATITSLFRPFPTEAHTTEALGTAIEGVFLAVLTIMSLRRLMTIPRRLRRQPYLL